MTNYEKIKAMTIDEMAKALCDQQGECYDCPYGNYCGSETGGARKWLTMEASDEGKGIPATS